jgi:hypothetical protein
MDKLDKTKLCPHDTDAPTAATTIMKLTKDHNSGKMVSEKSFLYDHLHILLDHLSKFERNPPDSCEEFMPQDLEDVRRYGRVQLYMPPTLWGHKNKLKCRPYSSFLCIYITS